MGPKESSSTKKPNAKRRAHPKVHSGCLTCKIRRVKCDEQRPRCKRCTKFGVLCDGYAPPKGLNPIAKPRPIYVDIRPSLHKAPPSPMFDSEEEFRYFETFSMNTAYEIFPMVELGRLRIMFLQACEFNRPIRQAIIALGALDMTSQASRPPSHTRCSARSNFSNSASHHYQNALSHYAPALKPQMDGDFRIALITSLVILSFEGWIGNHELAIKQIQIGTRLLKEWKEMYNGRSMSGLPTSALSEDEKLLSHVFTRLSIQLRSPPPNRPRPTIPLPPLIIDDPEKFERMPKSFSTLTEAEKFYSAIVRFAVTFVSQGLPRIARTSSLTGSYTVGAKSEAIPPDIAKAQVTLEASLRRWMAAFAYLKKTLEIQTLDEKKASITLELQMKATYLGTVKALAQDELVFDNYHHVYSDIVNLSEALLDCSKASKVPKFCFDSAVVIPLWFTGHKTRDPILRRRVIALLVNYPRREGVWDSVFAGLVIDCIRAFEEDYMEKGKIPGWARISNTSFDIDLSTRTVEIKCQQRASPTSNEMVTRRRTLDYYVHTGVTLEQVGAVIAR